MNNLPIGSGSSSSVLYLFDQNLKKIVEKLGTKFNFKNFQKTQTCRNCLHIENFEKFTFTKVS